jgi:hypothetical protein
LFFGAPDVYHRQTSLGTRVRESRSPICDFFQKSKAICRRPLKQATAADVARLSVFANLMAGPGQAALTQPQIMMQNHDTRIERFEKRLDLIRLSLDIPGMPVTVLVMTQ